MDSAIAMITIKKIKTSKKDEITTIATYTAPTEDEEAPLLASIVSFIIFVFAAYLSWNCNSKCTPLMTGIEKIIRSFIAGMFGTLYILIYLLSWSAGCSTCAKV